MIPAFFKFVPRIAPGDAAALVGLMVSSASGVIDIEPPEPPEDLDACVEYVLADGSDTLRTIRPEKWTEVNSTGMYWAPGGNPVGA
jgi:hypothetical protein